MQVKCSNPCVLLVFPLILINPENNPEFPMKEMALAGRPEPHGQRKCLWMPGQSLAGLPSDRLPHRELLVSPREEGQLKWTGCVFNDFVLVVIQLFSYAFFHSDQWVHVPGPSSMRPIVRYSRPKVHWKWTNFWTMVRRNVSSCLYFHLSGYRAVL